MAIRPARPDDLGAIRDCAAAAYGKYIDRIGRKPAPMIADFDSQIGRGIVHVCVDEAGPALCGFVVFYPRNDHVHLENVAVSADFQGRGVGRALIEHCEKQARSQGFAAVELYTNEAMTENLGLYRHLGYRETGRRQEDGFARVYFRKSL